MRKAFIETLTTLAQDNEKILLLTGDLGFSVFEDFAREFPQRFFNCGIAEANMMGVGAGLALSGFVPFVYSIAPFVTLRCAEQIRNDICLQNANVKIVGVGGGLCYGTAGYSHFAVEDIALMKSLENMVVACPADPFETEEIMRLAVEYDGPMYIRLGKGGDPVLYSFAPGTQLGKPNMVREGEDLLLIATGGATLIAIHAAESLYLHGIQAQVLSMPFVKPINQEALYDHLLKFKRIFTIEEHIIDGGFGETIASLLLETRIPNVIFKRFGLKDLSALVGKQGFIQIKQGLTGHMIAENILECINHFV